MEVLKDGSAPILTSSYVVKVRQMVREWAVAMDFSLVDQTKIVTAASELARNALDHGGGGMVRLEALNNATRRGLRLTFSDQGTGIADVEQALKDGFTTGRGMGLGLGGSKRLVNDFAHVLTPDQIATLENKLVAYDDSTSTQIVIVTIETTGDYDVTDYALKIMREWGVGNKEKNNGIVVLASINDHKIRIETGYGLEGAIPDVTANQIIQNSIGISDRPVRPCPHNSVHPIY